MCFPNWSFKLDNIYKNVRQINDKKDYVSKLCGNHSVVCAEALKITAVLILAQDWRKNNYKNKVKWIRLFQKVECTVFTSEIKFMCN